MVSNGSLLAQGIPDIENSPCFVEPGVPLPSIATPSTMTKSRRFCPSWTIFPKSVWMHRSSGESGVHGCKMYTRKQELTLFCGFDMTPWPKIAIEVGESNGYTAVKWKYNSFLGFRRESGKFESDIIARGPRNKQKFQQQTLPPGSYR
jgi:hypothetical protein